MNVLARNPVTADRPYAVIREQEADGAGGVADVLTIFLTAGECPVGCNMCDLWQNTLAGPTPPGAIPRQIDAAITELPDPSPRLRWIKLYNSGNFFDPNSIPESDYGQIAARCSGRARVIVENHPRFGRGRLRRFRDLVDGQLEVAVGLETVQPRWLQRLGKQMSRDDFDAYAKWLAEQQVDLRVFLIVGVPGISVAESIRWAQLSARHACNIGARHISLIPARHGHGWNGQAKLLPDLTAEHLYDLQQLLLADVNGRAVVTVDTWDLPQDQPVVSNIQHNNLSQTIA